MEGHRRWLTAAAGALLAGTLAVALWPSSGGGGGVGGGGGAELEQESLFVYGLGKKAGGGGRVGEAISRFESRFEAFMHGGEAALREGLGSTLQRAGAPLAELSSVKGGKVRHAAGTGGDWGLRELLGNAGSQIQNKFGEETDQKERALASLKNVENLLLRPESQQAALSRTMAEIDAREKVLKERLAAERAGGEAARLAREQDEEDAKRLASQTASVGASSAAPAAATALPPAKATNDALKLADAGGGAHAAPKSGETGAEPVGVAAAASHGDAAAAALSPKASEPGSAASAPTGAATGPQLTSAAAKAGGATDSHAVAASVEQASVEHAANAAQEAAEGKAAATVQEAVVPLTPKAAGGDAPAGTPAAVEPAADDVTKKAFWGKKAAPAEVPQNPAEKAQGNEGGAAACADASKSGGEIDPLNVIDQALTVEQQQKMLQDQEKAKERRIEEAKKLAKERLLRRKEKAAEAREAGQEKIAAAIQRLVKKKDERRDTMDKKEGLKGVNAENGQIDPDKEIDDAIKQSRADGTAQPAGQHAAKAAPAKQEVDPSKEISEALQRTSADTAKVASAASTGGVDTAKKADAKGGTVSVHTPDENPLQLISRALTVESKTEAAQKKIEVVHVTPEVSRLNHLFGSKVAGKVEHLFIKMKKSGIAAQALATSAPGGVKIKGAHALESNKDLAAERDLKLMQRKDDKAKALASVASNSQASSAGGGGGRGGQGGQENQENMNDVAEQDFEEMEKAEKAAHTERQQHVRDVGDDGVTLDRDATTMAERGLGHHLPRVMEHLFGNKVATKYSAIRQKEAGGVTKAMLSAVPKIVTPQVKQGKMDLQAQQDLQILKRHPQIGLLGGSSEAETSASSAGSSSGYRRR